MRIKRISSEENFNANSVVSSSDIFSRKTELSDTGDQKLDVKTFSDDGLFSRRIFGVMNTEEEFACDCGKYVGKFYEGILCDECNSEVRKIAANIDRAGWIDLGSHHIMKYIPYLFLEKIIGRENIKNVIHVPNIITIDGFLDNEAIKEIRESSPECKYWHVGIDGFYENYNEILDYYFYLNHKKEENLEPLLEDSGLEKKDINGNTLYNESKKHQEERRTKNFISSKFDVFTNKILILSAVLRPAMRTEDGLKLDELNILYVNILKNVEILNDKVNQLKLIQEITLEALQSQFFQLSENIVETVKSKNGLIRNQICGTRINFSARNIISPAKAGYKMDEIVLPYMTFLELFKYELINIMCRIKNIDFIEGHRLCFEATLKFDEDIYMVMKKMIASEEIGVLLNRRSDCGLIWKLMSENPVNLYK